MQHSLKRQLTVAMRRRLRRATSFLTCAASGRVRSQGARWSALQACTNRLLSVRWLTTTVHSLWFFGRCLVWQRRT